MKNYIYYLIASLILISVSCDKNESSGNYDSSKITVSIPECDLNSATVALFAQDVKSLGLFTVGICYSTDAEPTIQDSHLEIDVDSDTLLVANLTLNFYLTSLSKETDYYVKGYIISEGETYYSAEKNFTTTSNILRISVSDDFIPDGQEYWIVLSDNSTTILTQKIQNSTNYTFSDDIPEIADFHIFRLNTTTTTVTLFVQSFTDIVPDDFDLDNPYNSSSNVGQITVTISDIANFLRWGIAASWWWNTTSTPGITSLTTSLAKDPDDLFINYLPSDGSAPKYKFVEDVIPYSNYTYTMADLTAMTSFTDITLPENNYFTYTIAGYNTDYYTEYLRYHGHSYTSGFPGTFRLYYPTAIRSNYYWYSFYNNSTQQSFYNKLGSLPTLFFETFPEITIANSSQYVTTTSGIDNYSKYEVMDFCGFYSSSGYYIQWDFYKQPQMSNSVQIPEIPGEIKSEINNLTTDDLSFSDVGYWDILDGEVTNYTEYVDILLKQSSRFFDVIKERREYYQWVSKKSFEQTTKNYNIPE